MNKQLLLFICLQTFCCMMHANFLTRMLGLKKHRKRTESIIIEQETVTISNYCSEEDFKVYFDEGNFMTVCRSNSISVPVNSITKLWIAENKEGAVKFMVNYTSGSKIFINRRTNGSLHIGNNNS